MAETELERAEKRYAQAKARLQALRNREASKQRKLDTRRKVILGGALIDLAARDDAAASILDRLIRNLSRDQDRKIFEEWEHPRAGVKVADVPADEAPSPAPAPAPAPADTISGTKSEGEANTDRAVPGESRRRRFKRSYVKIDGI
jgi:hypothetical protein